MKKFIILLICCILSFFVNSNAKDDDIIKIRQGTFIKVIAREEINTLTIDKNDIFSFVNLEDMYIYETNVIPQNTIFYGRIEEVREPVEGMDGAVKIYIYKMISPEKKSYNVKAHIYSDNDNFIGGRRTASAYYHKSYSHSKGFKPMLQVVPLNIFEMGRHSVIRPGTELFLLLEEDIFIN